ncbi:Ppx/GppA family phosphatase [Nocardioides sp. W7]|uniref:Ppx/GppA phosphatase family protein n=1 Tax=Nocardioides sp. W7 TaxID=2931390 RepID=UPI001FCFABB3|nr:Ppx/GppA family phosphatase [Nocardioides sp. W7]
MNADTDPNDPVAPGVVPRWEWRGFGNFDEALDVLASLRAHPAVTSDETYLLSRSRDASVKVRAGLLDLKVLQHVDGAGLQLWVPTLKAGFPVSEGAAATAFEALGLPTPRRPRYTLEELVREALGSRDDVRVLDVHKSRHRSVLDGCMVEYTELTADGLTTRTVAVESPDSELVSATIRGLGLDGRPNTCVAKGLRSLLGWEPTRLAVLDVGTNSVKLNVSDRRDGGVPRTELDTAVVTRLGEGQAESGRLSSAAMRRTGNAIARLVETVRAEGPTEIVAVGTAGLRQAPNRGDFLDLVLARSDVVVQVISGPEEARLAYRAAVSSLPRTGGRLLVFDSGGGSSQFTFGSPDAIAEQFSLDVGAVHLTDRFALTGAVSRDTVDAALAAVETELVRLAGRPRPDTVIAIGGTSTNLAAVSRGLAVYDPDVVHGTVVDLAEVDRQIELYRCRSAQERREILGLQPARAAVILAGACIVRTIVTISGQDRLTVSDRGLRHGVAAERLAAHV